MKNLFFVFAFVFSIASANNDTQVIEEDLITMECMSVKTTCGIYGTVCGETHYDRVVAALDLDDWQCQGR